VGNPECQAQLAGLRRCRQTVFDPAADLCRYHAKKAGGAWTWHEGRVGEGELPNIATLTRTRF
jgi:hypothetical protein